MSKADWHHAPPGKWSCAQIFEHLLLSYAATTKGTRKAMEIGKPLGGRPTLRDRISTFYVAGLGLLPSGRTAPKHTTPKDGGGLESLRQFNDALVAMDATLTDAEKRFGGQSQAVGPSDSRAPYRKRVAAFSSHPRQAPPQASRRKSQEERFGQRLSAGSSKRSPYTTAMPLHRRMRRPVTTH